MTTAILIGASSDIALHVADRFLTRGIRVWGTYRSFSSELEALAARGAVLVQADVDKPEDVANFADRLRADNVCWDVLVSAVGVLSPIGAFFSTDFEEWNRSVATNSIGQLRALHALYPLRDTSRLTKAIFFAGGGTNSPFDNYSAYCIGKLALLKICELLHSECDDLQASILGTGWVNTKIHQQTIDAGTAAGINLLRTRDFLGEAEQRGTPMSDVLDCIDWCLAAPRDAVGGRNFAVAHDPWRDPAFVDRLLANGELCKFRRRQ